MHRCALVIGPGRRQQFEMQIELAAYLFDVVWAICDNVTCGGGGAVFSVCVQTCCKHTILSSVIGAVKVQKKKIGWKNNVALAVLESGLPSNVIYFFLLDFLWAKFLVGCIDCFEHSEYSSI